MKIRRSGMLRRAQDIRLREFAPGMQQQTVDSLWQQQYRMQQLSQLLTQQFPVFVKSYGINSLATLNFRGSSSAQSQVYWNGVPLNNASFGATDISLLTVNQFDKINLLYGGSSALLGSGNVGGALLLDNDLHTSDSFKSASSIGLEWGIFRQRRVNLHQLFSGRRWSLSANVNVQHADNNFTYQDLSGKDQEMTNATLRSASAMLNALYRISGRSSLKASFWTVDYYREIPPALFEALSVKQQRDKAYRGMLHWQQEQSGYSLYSKAAFSVEQMHYTDSASGMNTRNQVMQFYEESGWKKKLTESQTLLVFIPVNVSWMRPDADTQIRYQYRIGLATAYSARFWHNLLQVAVSARLERINQRSVLLPGVNTSFHPWHFITFKANLQRSFRAPTLNELYYQPGGNFALLPEYGWSADAGYELNLAFGQHVQLKQEAAVFNRNVHDWILWFGGSIWTPHNIATVHSRGMETANTLSIQVSRSCRFWLGVNTSFVLATTVESYLPGDGSIGKQIPYTPRYNGQGNIGCVLGPVTVNYNHTYTGYRFVTIDESQYLKPFQTGNLYVRYAYKIRSLAFSLSAAMNNIWNMRYQVVNARPMPGRNCSVGLGFSF